MYMSLAVLHLYRWFHQWFMQHVFNIKVKNLAFDTSKNITNAWFSMKNYSVLKLSKVVAFYTSSGILVYNTFLFK